MSEGQLCEIAVKLRRERELGQLLPIYISVLK